MSEIRVQDYLVPDNLFRRTKKKMYGFTSGRNIIGRILTWLNVPHFDPCCPDDGESAPVRYNTTLNRVEAYSVSSKSWVDINTIDAVTTTTTTSTTTTTTAAPTTTTTTTVPSDMNLKMNIQETGSMVGKLKEYTWEWNDKAQALNLTKYPTKGVLAQEAMIVYPEFVTMHKDGYYMVNLNAISQS
jgi:hypothetical protein